jgi:hypothetical protein
VGPFATTHAVEVYLGGRVDYDDRKTDAGAYRWSNGVQQGWFFGTLVNF